MRRWQVLLAAGLVGVASLLFVPVELLLSRPIPPVLLRLLATINPIILCVVAVLVGERTARRVGFGAPMVEAWLAGAPIRPVIRRQLPPALLSGIAVALLLIAYGATIGRSLTALAAGSPLAGFDLPIVTKLVYGGITEELLTRWGLVSLFSWIGWRLTGRPERVSSAVVMGAVLLAALFFGLGHVPALLAFAPAAPPSLLAGVVAANALPGALFGLLFVRYGLEAAMMAHALAHLLVTAGAELI